MYKRQNIVNGNPGQYVIRIADNKKSWDTTYPGVEVLEDGTILTTTYGHWQEGEQPYIISVRLKANEIDELAQKSPKLSIKPDTMHLQ